MLFPMHGPASPRRLRKLVPARADIVVHHAMPWHGIVDGVVAREAIQSPRQAHAEDVGPGGGERHGSELWSEAINLGQWPTAGPETPRALAAFVKLPCLATSLTASKPLSKTIINTLRSLVIFKIDILILISNQSTFFRLV